MLFSFSFLSPFVPFRFDSANFVRKMGMIHLPPFQDVPVLTVMNMSMSPRIWLF